MKKSLIAILMTAVFIVSIIGPMLSIPVNAVAADDPTWYYTEHGQLGTDTYYLYPFNQSTTNVGISQFGEFIDNNTNIGLEYAYTGGSTGRDPWAAPAGPSLDLGILPKSVWINGWFMDLTYVHNNWGVRNVWAGALFADLVDYGKPWLRVVWQNGSDVNEASEDFRDPGLEINASIPMMLTDSAGDTYLNPAYTGSLVSSDLLDGGRKTNGTAYTEPIQILYDGPRKFIAVLITYIADYNYQTHITFPLIKLTLTVIFNKDKKEIVELKDVKLLPHAKATLSGLPVMVTDGPTLNDSLSIQAGVLCQFGDRQEWDLGAKTYGSTTAYSSYAHYYTDGTASNDTENYDLHTDYNKDWTLVTTLPSRTIVNGITVNAWGPEPHNYGEYDLAQIISNDKKFVGFAAHWPSLSDWSIDALYGHNSTADVTWYRAMKADDPHYIDHTWLSNTEPWQSPCVIGEWDFILSGNPLNSTGLNTKLSIISDIQFRGVSVYGVTDLHDGVDMNFAAYPSPLTNKIDSEVCYLLEEVFKPYDLKDALGYNSFSLPARWVDHFVGDGVTKDFQLLYSNVYPDEVLTDHWPYVNLTDIIQDDWSEYAEFTERVLIGNTLMKPTSGSYNPCSWGYDYVLTATADDFAWVNFTHAPANNTYIKILFSTCDYNGYQWLTVGRDSAVIDSEGAAMLGFYLAHEDLVLEMSATDMDYPMAPASPGLFAVQRPALLPSRDAYLNKNPVLNNGTAGLKDDYCTHENVDSETDYNGVPISSANIINIGGPSASLTAQYFNDFDDVFATLPTWTPNLNNLYKIMPVSCWSLNRNDSVDWTFHAYVPEYDANGVQTVGYGVISVYLDLNGTVGLNIWGYTGQDTYFTAWAILHSDVWALFEANMPCGLTSVVLKFDYTLHPTDFCFVKIVEALGTITEYNVQAVFERHVTTISGGDYDGYHYWCGGLPYHWFHTPDPDGAGTDYDYNRIIELWTTDGTNWPAGSDGTDWIRLKYPPIHPDP